MLGLDGATLKAIGAVAGLAAVPTIGGIYSVIASRNTGRATVEAARIAAITTADAKAGEVSEQRAQRVAGEVDALIKGLNGLIESQGKQIERLWSEVQANQDAISRQRHDMDAIANEKAALTAQVERQADRIADLETNDKLKTGLLDRLQQRLTLSLGYSQTLTKQLIDYGHEPEPPPPGLRGNGERH